MDMKLLVASLLILLIGNSFSKSEVIETRDYSDVFKRINQVGDQYGSENVLVVFDIDDTLLVIEHCKKPNGEMTRGIGKLYSCPSEHTESDLSLKIASIQDKGFATIALTARGNSLISPTRRELARKHEGLKTFDFAAKPFIQEIKNIKVAKTKRCKKGQTPPCLSGKFSTYPKFLEGVMYANGTHKGLALKALLEALGESFKAIVFIDDRVKNTKNMDMIYKDDKNVDLTNFLYLRHRD